MKEGMILKAPDRMGRVSDNIISQIRSLVSSGVLAPGDKIGSEKELLGQLGVSKASLREALRVLEVMGMIEIRKGLSGGVFVADVDMKTTLTGIMNFINFEAVSSKDITLMRYILEPMIVRVIAPLVSEPDMANLEAMIRREFGSPHGDSSATAIKGIGFHRSLARITHNPILIMIADFIDNLLSDLKAKVELGDDFYRKVTSYHQQAVLALRRRDIDEVVRILISDILFVDRTMATCLRSEPFDPAGIQEAAVSATGTPFSGEAAALEGEEKRAAGDGTMVSQQTETGKILLREVGSGRLFLFVGGTLAEEQRNGCASLPQGQTP